MENSSIEWTDHTFNLWRGCREVSPGCKNCYARELSKRNHAVLGCWGKGAERVLAKPAYRRKPLRWNAVAAAGRFRECLVCGRREARRWEGIGLASCSTPGCLSLSETESVPVRPRVFCASLSDWLDEEVPIEWLADLLGTVRQTPHLDWLMLTKRPQNFSRVEECVSYDPEDDEQHLTAAFARDWLTGHPPANVWMGTTVEDQPRADERIPLLAAIPAKVHFLSCEPLVGPVELFDVDGSVSQAMQRFNPREMRFPADVIDWVICGGESGYNARAMRPAWARALRDECVATEKPFLFKQWGRFRPTAADETKMEPVGVKAAGRLLDGREWNGFPSQQNNPRVGA